MYVTEGGSSNEIEIILFFSRRINSTSNRYSFTSIKPRCKVILDCAILVFVAFFFSHKCEKRTKNIKLFWNNIENDFANSCTILDKYKLCTFSTNDPSNFEFIQFSFCFIDFLFLLLSFHLNIYISIYSEKLCKRFLFCS